MTQINGIIDKTPDMRWLITDSPRTPAETCNLLRLYNKDNVTYVDHREHDHAWLPSQLRRAAAVWITEDSVSMIYEALTAGTAVGLLEVPVKHRHRIASVPAHLRAINMVTQYQDWAAGASLASPPLLLNESARCAEILLQRFAL